MTTPTDLHPHSRAVVAEAIIERLNSARGAALAQARSDFAAAYPGSPVPDYPASGPVLPVASLDDPADTPPDGAKIIRALRLFSDSDALSVSYVGGGAEVDTPFSLEWIVLSPAPQSKEGRAIREKGIAEIAAALAPCETRLEDPANGKLLALHFQITRGEYPTHDVGDYHLHAAYITIETLLDKAHLLA